MREDVKALVEEARHAMGAWHGWQGDQYPEGDKHVSLIARLATALEARAALEDAKAESFVIEGPEWARISLKEARDHAEAEATLYRTAAALLRSLTERVKELEEALEPFAVEYREQERFWPDKARVVAWAPFREAYRITIDDLRRARRARGEP